MTDNENLVLKLLHAIEDYNEIVDELKTNDVKIIVDFQTIPNNHKLMLRRAFKADITEYA